MPEQRSPSVEIGKEHDPISQPFWYAVYTSARCEKRVAQQFTEKSIEHFLPLYGTVHRWKNGRHRVELPLFSGYVFVRIPLTGRLPVVQTPGVVRLVGFGGLPLRLDDSEIEGMRSALSAGMIAEPYPYLTAGMKVEISSGPLQGRQGILLRRRKSCRVVLSLDAILRSIAVEVDEASVVPVTKGSSSPRTGFRASTSQYRLDHPVGCVAQPHLPSDKPNFDYEVSQ